MNYARFSIWVDERVEDLVAFGVPRDEACGLVKSLEVGAIATEARVRSERQFLLDFKQVGAVILAKRLGVSPSAIWARRVKLLTQANSPCVLESMVD